jgi:hypothetical protein
MPFKSKAQQRYMYAAEERGDIEEGTASRWAKETKNIKDLPEKAKTAKKAAYNRLRRTGGSESP